ncbi:MULTISPECIES: hypothetical protein [Caproicibacterium]|uniref:Uncharacterized protein n=1 Tax=Caproicibacterium argilliputei TaxID=3030016 RepID=A0AA97H1A5_9FIRM|nr:hypothetical protein [Caproicibacterium argilliputei]WOC32446.1 hypothetical protein PXC00_00845 [Caproicibacterium argilliputei]
MALTEDFPTLPFRSSIKNDIMKWQCDHPQFPMHFFDREYYEFPGGFLWAGDTETSEYAFCTVSLMPLLTYSLKQLALREQAVLPALQAVRQTVPCQNRQHPHLLQREMQAGTGTAEQAEV